VCGVSWGEGYLREDLPGTGAGLRRRGVRGGSVPSSRWVCGATCVAGWTQYGFVHLGVDPAGSGGVDWEGLDIPTLSTHRDDGESDSTAGGGGCGGGQRAGDGRCGDREDVDAGGAGSGPIDAVGGPRAGGSVVDGDFHGGGGSGDAIAVAGACGGGRRGSGWGIGGAGGSVGVVAIEGATAVVKRKG